MAEMRALRLHPPDTLKIDTASPIPTPSPTQYLIRVHATAITANELTWSETLERSFPIPGHDVSGTIASASPGASPRFDIGTEVFALTSFSRDGAAAEYVVAEANELASKPSNLNSKQAAAVPLSVLTAWQALFVHGGLAPGSGAGSGVSVLVLGAAGGVGVMAVQLLRWYGAQKIVGTCSGRNAAFVMGLGAHEIADYTKEEVGGKFDLVLDCVGGAAQEGGWRNVKDGGILVSVATPLPDKRAEYPNVRSSFFVVEPDGGLLGKLSKMFESGDLEAVVDAEFPLDEGAEAFRLLAKGHTRGKIVLVL